MALSPLPKQGQAFVGQGGQATAPFYLWLSSLDRVVRELVDGSTGGGGTFLPTTTQVQGIVSIVSIGTLAGGVVQLRLQNDAAAPGNTTAYGTNGAGAKGWFPIANAVAVTAGELTKAVAGTGVSTFGLADVADAGGGTLQNTQFDAKGRKSGTSAATTDDLAEGAGNLYFTTERAQDATGAMAANSANVTLAYVDATPSLTADLTNTAVAAGSYGSASQIATFTVDGKGRLTAAGQTAVSSAAITHNSTTGLQGGTPGEYNHLTNAQVDKLDDLVAPKGQILGLGMTWDSATGITVASGAAYLEGEGRVVEVPSALVASGLALAATTWHHVYLYLSSGTPTLEFSTTAPAAPYDGTARSKTGDTSRRYLGSLRTDGAGNIFNFLQVGDLVLYREQLDAAPFRLVANGTATTTTAVSAAAIAPATARAVLLRVFNLSSAAGLQTGTSDGSASMFTFNPGDQVFLTHPVNTSQEMTYAFLAVPSPLGTYIDATGYHYER